MAAFELSCQLPARLWCPAWGVLRWVMQIQLKLQHHHLPLIAFRHLQDSSPAVARANLVTTGPQNWLIRHAAGR